MTEHERQVAAVRRSLRRRARSEKRFRAYGIIAIAIALGALVVLFADIIGKGHSGFLKTTPGCAPRTPCYDGQGTDEDSSSSR